MFVALFVFVICLSCFWCLFARVCALSLILFCHCSSCCLCCFCSFFVFVLGRGAVCCLNVFCSFVVCFVCLLHICRVVCSASFRFTVFFAIPRFLLLPPPTRTLQVGVVRFLCQTPPPPSPFLPQNPHCYLLLVGL